MKRTASTVDELSIRVCGMHSDEIATEGGRSSFSAAMGIAALTVPSCISRIYAKVGVSSWQELKIWAREQGLDK